MDDKASEISKRRLEKLREQEAYYGIACPPEIRLEIEDIEQKLKECPNSVSLTLSARTDRSDKVVIRNTVIISVVTGAVMVAYALWSYGRPLTTELAVASISFGTSIGLFLGLVIELATSRFQSR
jgi:hypothetical protein